MLLRSAAAVQIEREKNPDQFALFDVEGPKNPAGVTLVVYRFMREGMKLSVAPTIQIPGRKRLAALGIPEYVGSWPYEGTVEPPPPFDQDKSDPFVDVGDLGDEQEEGDAQ
ncbi:MAG: hypothetical protein M3Y42_13385 [Actinomycetota bacterium]|nr:hypothetical protein [Actinomycetota bacterium]